MAQHLKLSVLLDHMLQVRALTPVSLEHMESCAHCRSDLRWLEQLDALRNFEPPKPAVEAVLRAFKEKARSITAA